MKEKHPEEVDVQIRSSDPNIPQILYLSGFGSTFSFPSPRDGRTTRADGFYKASKGPKPPPKNCNDDKMVNAIICVFMRNVLFWKLNFLKFF